MKSATALVLLVAIRLTLGTDPEDDSHFDIVEMKDLCMDYSVRMKFLRDEIDERLKLLAEDVISRVNPYIKDLYDRLEILQDNCNALIEEARIHKLKAEKRKKEKASKRKYTILDPKDEPKRKKAMEGRRNGSPNADALLKKDEQDFMAYQWIEAFHEVTVFYIELGYRIPLEVSKVQGKRVIVDYVKRSMIKPSGFLSAMTMLAVAVPAAFVLM